MNFGLDDEYVLLRETARDFATNEIAPKAEEFNRLRLFPYEIVEGLAGLGFLGIPFPEEYGGAGADTLAFALVVEELARVDSSVAITVAAHTSLGTSPIWLFGTDEQRAHWLPPLASGKMLGAFGLTEPEAGSDAGRTRTTAVLDDGQWVVNGTKCFITNAGTDISGVTTVAAITGTREDGRKEISCILIPRGTAGYSQSAPYSKTCWYASDTRELSFVDCRVPAENVLGERGRGLAQFLRILDGGRIAVAAMGLGLAQGAYEMSLRYSRERCQFGQPIGRFQAIAFKLADMATRIEAARLLLYKAARLKDADKPFKKTAAMAKLMCSELAVYAADEAVQIHGGYGVMDEYPVSRFYRDAKVLTIGEGTNEIQRLVISRELGL
jgi:alkylation response protein AidB-like acyl-CoA dehydrogenase